MSSQELLVLFLTPLLVGWGQANNLAGPCKLPLHLKRKREGRKEKETHTRILTCSLIALRVECFLIFERNSHRRAILINKTNIKISGLGIKL